MPLAFRRRGIPSLESSLSTQLLPKCHSLCLQHTPLYSGTTLTSAPSQAGRFSVSWLNLVPLPRPRLTSGTSTHTRKNTMSPLQRAASNLANSSSSPPVMISERHLLPRTPLHGRFPSTSLFLRSLVSNLGFTLSLLVPNLIRTLSTSHVLCSNMTPLVLKSHLAPSLVSAPISFSTSNTLPVARPHSLAQTPVPMGPYSRHMLSKDPEVLIMKGPSTKFPFMSVDPLSAFLRIRRVQLS